MFFNDVLKYDLAVFPSIFPNRGAVLNQLFVVNGNGMDWDKDGKLANRLGDTSRLNELVAIERFVGAGLHKQPVEGGEDIPNEILKHLNSMQIPADIEDRLYRSEYTHWYPMSQGYNNLENLPDNIPADWLNAAWECATLIVNTPLDVDLEREVSHTIHHFLDVPVFDEKGYKVIGREQNTPEEAEKKARKSVIDTRQRVYTIAAQALERMTAQFPNHKFEQNPIPTFDKDRPFETTGSMNVIPWPVNGDPAKFDLVIDPFEQAIRFAYTLRRKNQVKDIPYDGLPLGHDERVCSIGPEERFTVESLRYDKDDQGRDALEVILCCMAQICIEQGRRIANKKLKEELNRYYSHLKFEAHQKVWRAEQEEKAKTDPKVAARLRIIDRINVGIKPAHDINDPLEVEVADEMQTAHREAMRELLAELDMTANG